MKYVVIAAAACLLAGCQTGADLVEASSLSNSAAAPYELSRPEIAAIKAGLKAELDDVSNSRIENVGAVKSGTGAVTACGYVGGDSGQGSKLEDVPFIGVFGGPAAKTSFVVVVVGGADVNSRVVVQMCDEKGISF